MASKKGQEAKIPFRHRAESLARADPEPGGLEGLAVSAARAFPGSEVPCKGRPNDE